MVCRVKGQTLPSRIGGASKPPNRIKQLKRELPLTSAAARFGAFDNPESLPLWGFSLI
jgi:hypothetical protein